MIGITSDCLMPKIGDRLVAIPAIARRRVAGWQYQRLPGDGWQCLPSISVIVITDIVIITISVIVRYQYRLMVTSVTV